MVSPVARTGRIEANEMVAAMTMMITGMISLRRSKYSVQLLGLSRGLVHIRVAGFLDKAGSRGKR